MQEPDEKGGAAQPRELPYLRFRRLGNASFFGFKDSLAFRLPRHD